MGSPYYNYELSEADRLCFDCPLPRCYGIEYRDCPLGQALRSQAPPFRTDSIPDRILQLLATAGPLTEAQAKVLLGTSRTSTATALSRLFFRALVTRSLTPGTNRQVWLYELRRKQK